MPRLIAAALLAVQSQGFRIFNESTDFYDPVFFPHQKGTTGYYGEPTNLKRERVNEGAAETATIPRQANDVKARQNCLNMVGPLGDGKYYCRAKEYGYCDRRSGTCFCNQGYQGLDCFKCTPTHFRKGQLCYPKKKCPNDCSGAGECDYATGECKCESHRRGIDCSEKVCQSYHEFCTECTDSSCVGCISGWFVNSSAPVGMQCTSCTTYDPRCTVCDTAECLQCGDPLLLSVRRSGRRHHDPLLPYDELTRELSQEHPFGTQRAEAFDEAESFNVISGEKPLHQAAKECNYMPPDVYFCDFQHQKYPQCDPLRRGAPDMVEHSDWDCSDWTVSHVVCGHAGSISFSSPTYAVEESAGFVQLTIRRSGGGVGEVSVEFELQHRGTDSSDVSKAAYREQQVLTFKEGVVQLTFIVFVHDDRVREPDESFSLTLHSPTGGAVLGVQKVATVTIMDDDAPKTRPDFSTASGLQLQNTAGETNRFKVQAVSASRLLQSRGADRFEVEVINTPPPPKPDAPPHPTARGLGNVAAPSGRPMHIPAHGASDVRGYGLSSSSRIPAAHGTRSAHQPWSVGNSSVVDNHDGTYDCTWQVDRQGVYSVMVRQAVPNGLVGEYFNNIYLEGEPAFTRVDTFVGFTWGLGRLTDHGADFVGVRWRGKVQSPKTGVVTFEVTADDHARLWVDGVLLVDRWDVKCGTVRSKLRLTKGQLYDIVLEYRDLRGFAEAQLFWCYEDPCSPEPVHTKYLYQMHHVAGSPFPNIQVRAAETSAPHSVARGEGLWQATAGVTAHFELFPRDRFGNQQQMQVSVTDKFYAKADISLPDPRGDAEGSPDTVDASLSYPARLIYSEEPISNTDEDCHGPVGKRTTGETQGLACRKGVTGDEHYATRFVGQYTPEVAGEYLLHVMLDGAAPAEAAVYGSPFKVVVSPAHTNARVSRVWGAGLSEGTTGELAMLRIEAHDVFGNLRQKSGDLFEVYAYHDGGKTYAHDDLAEGQDAQDRAWGARRALPSVVVGTVRPVGGSPGTYDAAFRPLLKGNYKVAVTLNGLHVASSPYTVLVQTSDAEPRACPAWGANIATATADQEASFHVEIRDSFNNHIVDGGGADFAPAMTLTGRNIAGESPLASHAPLVTGACVYLSDKYKCTYTPNSSGQHKLAVRVRGRHIRGSPFTVDVSPGDAKGTTSSAAGQGLYSARAGDTAFFTVQAKDSMYNKKLAGGDAFAAALTYYDGAIAGINGETSGGAATAITATSKYLEDGRYELSYTPTVRGNYRLDVTLSGDHIIGSPFYPYVSPAAPSARHSVLSGGGLRAGEAGYLSRVVVDLHDRFGNHLEFGGAQLVAKYVYLGGHTTDPAPIKPLFAHVHDFGNGSYDCSYTPLHAGRWRAELSFWMPGGLNASLYSAADIERYPSDSFDDNSQSALVLRSVDAEVDFDWKTATYAAAPGQVYFQRPSARMPHDHWGGRWEGKLKAPHSENYTFHLSFAADDGARLLVGGRMLVDAWTNGVAGTHTAGTLSASLPLRAGFVYSLEVQYRDLLGPAALKLEWESASTPRVVVPASALYRLLRVGPHAPVSDVIPTITSAAACVAEGDALYSATAGVEASFTLRSRDIFGNQRLDGGDVFRVEATGAGADRFVADPKSQISDRGDGSYVVRYTPTAAGFYALAVTYNAPVAHRDLSAYQVARSLSHSHVKGSPFALRVHSGPTDPTLSVATGEGLVHCAAGESATFTIQSKDKHGNDRDAGNDQWIVELSGPAGSMVAGSAVAKSLGRGRYESMYTPVTAGSYALAVSLHGVAALGSPFRAYVSPGPAHAPSCKASGAGLGAATVGQEVSFTVTAFDAFGNARAEAGDAFVARLYGPESMDLLLRSDGARSGVYTGTYTAPAAGAYELSIALANGPSTSTSSSGSSASGTSGSTGGSGGGLVGHYYNNQWLRGRPEHSQVDPSITFDWGTGLITHTAADLVSVRWTGYIEAEFSEEYTFTVSVDHVVSLAIGGEVILDSTKDAPTSSGTYSSKRMMQAGVLTAIRLEYREDRGPAHLSLYWSSDRLAKEIVPPSLLYPGSSAIEGSPFSVTVT